MHTFPKFCIHISRIIVYKGRSFVPILNIRKKSKKKVITPLLELEQEKKLLLQWLQQPARG